MSESIEKVLGIKHLPIFPLPIVLLPFELLPLHIFEERYRQMLKDIELKRNLFGLSFFDPQETLHEKPEKESIGCVAEVREVKTLPDGRADILTIGVIRYRLKDYLDLPDPYLVAEVEFFEDFEESESELQPLADEVFALFTRIAKAAHNLGGHREDFSSFPQAPPEQMSFLIAAAFNLDANLKYRLIEMRSTGERLLQLRDILSRAIDRIEESVKIIKISQSNGHANKKINL